MAQKSTADLSVHQPLSPVYLLFGTQDYLLRTLTRSIIAKALPAEEQEFNVFVYDMNVTLVSEAIEEANTVPFMGERKIIVMESSFFLSAEHAQSKVVQDVHPLELYLEQPSPSAVVIFTAPYEKLDRRKKVVKLLLQSAEVRELSRISEADSYRLMDQVARAAGAVYTREGHEQLVASVGSDLGRLANEVNKCALYCGPEDVIDRAAVLEIGSRSLETNVFLLVNAVMKRQGERALHLFHDLIRMREEPLKLLALLERQLRIVYRIIIYQQKGVTAADAATKIGIHPYAAKMAAEQAKVYAAPQLERALAGCAEADYAIKTGAANKILVFELLLEQLTHS
ncbi:MAG: DNA polymerase III subunit delta [Sporolactobacillus sp.]